MTLKEYINSDWWQKIPPGTILLYTDWKQEQMVITTDWPHQDYNNSTTWVYPVFDLVVGNTIWSIHKLTVPYLKVIVTCHINQ